MYFDAFCASRCPAAAQKDEADSESPYGRRARPAAQRAEALKERFTFKQEMDDDAKKQMFPQNARLAKG